jgi:hypothetical protein
MSIEEAELEAQRRFEEQGIWQKTIKKML